MTTPLVSVVLPAYNGAACLRGGLDCILAQTFKDFELIVIDDGSTDATAQIVESVADPRIRFFRQKNQGLAATLNRGIALARGKYVARQDQDDLSLPSRFACQVALLEADPGCALVGTRAEIWVGDTPTGRNHDHPVDDASLRFELLFNNPFVHSSVMLRKDAVVAAGGYTTDPTRQPPEDYELWSRLARHHRVANLPERLVIYREEPNSMCRTVGDTFKTRLATISAENIAFANGLAEPNTAIRDMAALTHGVSELISPRPSFAAMKAALDNAARAIAATSGNPASILVRRDAHLRRLRGHHLVMQHSSFHLVWQLARTAKRQLSALRR